MDVLLTNDDGIDAPGLAALRAALEAADARVVTVAPRTQQSGCGAALTLSQPLTLEEFHDDGLFCGYQLSGTPVDCVKVALARLMRDRPALVASGVNAGSNLGVHALYSGTIGAGLEAAFQGLPALAVSRKNFLSTNFDATRAVLERLLARLLPAVLAHPGVLFNVNLPDLEPPDIQGLRVAPLDLSVPADVYEESPARDVPRTLTPIYVPLGWNTAGSDTDVALLNRGFITITPLRPDLTCRATLAALRSNGALRW